jgi:hypothetical protein
VEQRLVAGWDDPRMPTIAGIRRRGYTPEAIRDFCSRIGVAKKENVIDMALLVFPCGLQTPPVDGSNVPLVSQALPWLCGQYLQRSANQQRIGSLCERKDVAPRRAQV